MTKADAAERSQLNIEVNGLLSKARTSIVLAVIGHTTFKRASRCKTGRGDGIPWVENW